LAALNAPFIDGLGALIKNVFKPCSGFDFAV